MPLSGITITERLGRPKLTFKIEITPDGHGIEPWEVEVVINGNAWD
jgi:hypothetical protein